MSAQPPMPVPAIPVADHELARRVLHWLAVGGVVLGSAQVFVAGITLLAWGFPFSFLRQWPLLSVLYRVTAVAAIIAPAILLAGSLGLLRERSWARSALTMYAFLQIAGALANQGLSLALPFTNAPVGWTAVQKVTAPLMGIESMLLHCLYPAAVIVCLVRPGLVPLASPATSTFQVLAPAAAPQPVSAVQS